MDGEHQVTIIPGATIEKVTLKQKIKGDETTMQISMK